MRLQLVCLLFGVFIGPAIPVSLVNKFLYLPAADGSLQRPLFDSVKSSQTIQKKVSGTIYEQLANDPKQVVTIHVTIHAYTIRTYGRFSRLTKALNLVQDVASFLNDSSAQQVTLVHLGAQIKNSPFLV